MNTTDIERLTLAIPAFCGPNGGGKLTGIEATPIKCAPGALSIDKAHFVALWMEALFFGMFAIMYGMCLWVLLRKDKKLSAVPYSMLAASTAMFFLAVAHMTVDLYRGLQASFGMTSSPLFYVAIAEPLFIAKNAIYFSQTLISDAFIIYRCWVIWGRSWKAAWFPTSLVIANIFNGVVLAVRMAHPDRPDATLFDDQFLAFFSSYMTLTFVANGTATALIAIRIFLIRAKFRRAGSSSGGLDVTAAAIILMESGAIYSVTLLALLITYVTKSNSQYIILDSVTPIIGIVFTTIIIRVAMGVSPTAEKSKQGLISGHSKGASSSFGGATTGLSRMSGVYVPDVPAPPRTMNRQSFTPRTGDQGEMFSYPERKASLVHYPVGAVGRKRSPSAVTASEESFISSSSLLQEKKTPLREIAERTDMENRV